MTAKKDIQRKKVERFKYLMTKENMSLQCNLSICLSDIPKDRLRKSNNGKIYASLDLAVRKEPDQWGRDLKVWITQTQADREARQNKIYVGSGKIVIFELQQGQAATEGDYETLMNTEQNENTENLPY